MDIFRGAIIQLPPPEQCMFPEKFPDTTAAQYPHQEIHIAAISTISNPQTMSSQ